MPGSLSYEHSRDRKSYLAPTGVEPTVYMHQLSTEAEAFCKERDFHTALRLLQKCLAVVSYYRGSRTVHAAQAMAKLAFVTREAGNERDARTWAYHSMRAYAALMMDNEAPRKRHIAESIAMLDEAYPGIIDAAAAQSQGVPDFTSGKLRYPQLPEETQPVVHSPSRPDRLLS